MAWPKKKIRDFDEITGKSLDLANKILTNGKYSIEKKLEIAKLVLNKAMPSKTESDVNMRGSIKVELEQMREAANKLLKDHLAANERAD